MLKFIGDAMLATLSFDTADQQQTCRLALDAAIEAMQSQYPDGVYEHDGDISDGGDITLIWACESDSINDAGEHAVASIRALVRS